MQTRYSVIIGLLGFIGLAACAPTTPTDGEQREATRDALTEAAEGAHRSESNRARNSARNPVETLDFFGLRQDMKVVELWPGGGWYTEVLAPTLNENGRLVAASFDTESEVEYQARIGKAYLEKLAEDPDLYGPVEIVAFDPPRKASLGEPNSADMVVTFRNLHGWVNDDVAESVFRAVLEVLQPGGTFGVVQHRAEAGQDASETARSGYVPEDYVIELAERVGFRLQDRSETNANPRDSKDHEYGVWTLPPSMRACRDLDGAEKTDCEDHYRSIGESDRMTLKFVKPE
ncbi:putative methyltransferase [Natronospira proteinivora]|uniref:Methyltransferase n=1 Tax=Natronospira proteinivora TaxID=1807133 RepID=A0ABT1G779_9GAMM|nr:methyltransferase [Natronospira proteinivora]MCP1727153.1 putative methyltransferase [Natronospira proteinivora]